MRKLLKQALIALEGAVYAGKTIEHYADPRLRPLSETNYRTLLKLGYKKESLVDRAIDAIRAELARPAPEPVAWFIYSRPTYQQVDPVHKHDDDVFPLYAAPVEKPISSCLEQLYESGKELPDHASW